MFSCLRPVIILCYGIIMSESCVVVFPSLCGSCLSCVALGWALDSSMTGLNAQRLRTGPRPGQSVSRLVSSLANIFELLEPQRGKTPRAKLASS